MSDGEKNKIREIMWRLLDDRNVARVPFPIEGRIPNFDGADFATGRITGVKSFSEAEVVKVNPDYAQVEVRRNVLNTDKSLIMPNPRLRGGFLILDPDKIPSEKLDYSAKP